MSVVPPVPSPWADGLGRAGSRAIQVLAVTAVAGLVLYLLLAIKVWAVLQVWTTRYQSGDDPLLGPDPVSPAEGVADRVSRLQYRKYQRMRRQARPAPWAAPPPRRLPSRPQSSP